MVPREQFPEARAGGKEDGGGERNRHLIENDSGTAPGGQLGKAAV